MKWGHPLRAPSEGDRDEELGAHLREFVRTRGADHEAEEDSLDEMVGGLGVLVPEHGGGHHQLPVAMKTLYRLGIAAEDGVEELLPHLDAESGDPIEGRQGTSIYGV